MKFESFFSSSAGNLYRISSGKHSMLVECGVPLQKIKHALGYKMDVIGCLVSHSHADHSMGAASLMRSGVDLYCSEHVADECDLSGHRLHIIEPGKQFKIGSFLVVPFYNVHDVPCMGFLISDGEYKLLFSVDTACVQPRFKGLTHICIETNWSAKTLSDVEPFVLSRLKRSHMSLETCLKFFKAQDLKTVQEIHLLHLSQANSDADLFKKEVMAATGKPVYVAG